MVKLQLPEISVPDTRLIIDVPPSVLGLIFVGLIVALHFGSEPKNVHVGAASDSSVRKALANEPKRPRVLRIIMVMAGFSCAAVGVMAVLSPKVLEMIMPFLPI